MHTDEPRGIARAWLTRGWVRFGIIAFVVLVTAVFVVQSIRKPGVYWSDVHVRFVAPTNPTTPNSLQVSERSLVMTAGAVGQAVDDRDRPATSSSDVHISGLGIRSGSAITLPNTGGQYQNYFADPYLDIQVVGPTEAQVQVTMKRIVSEIKAKLGELQDNSNVARQDRIGAKVLPLSATPVYYEQGSRKRALGAAIIILVGVGAAAATILTRLTRRPRKSSLALVA